MDLINKLLTSKVLASTLFIGVTLVIIYMTLMPPDRLGNHQIYEYDKFGHFFVFFIWSLSFGIFLNSFKKKYVNLYFIFITGSLFGIFIELLQDWTALGRTADMADALADILGCLLAVLALKFFKPILLKKRNHKMNFSS